MWQQVSLDSKTGVFASKCKEPPSSTSHDQGTAACPRDDRKLCRPWQGWHRLVEELVPVTFQKGPRLTCHFGQPPILRIPRVMASSIWVFLKIGDPSGWCPFKTVQHGPLKQGAPEKLGLLLMHASFSRGPPKWPLLHLVFHLNPQNRGTPKNDTHPRLARSSRRCTASSGRPLDLVPWGGCVLQDVQTTNAWLPLVNHPKGSNMCMSVVVCVCVCVCCVCVSKWHTLFWLILNGKPKGNRPSETPGARARSWRHPPG